MRTGHIPVVSIGMPAFNSAATIRSAIDCMLAQSFTDFELIVSDNASTDETWSIIQDYMQRDDRVRGIRQPNNIGANANYTAVFLAARGRYFKWASSNDWCAPAFLQRCIEYLEEDPSTVLVAPRTRIFQHDLESFDEYDRDLACMQPDAVDRFIDVASRMALNNVVNGVVRADALRRTRLVEHYPGADVVLVADLALGGRIALLPDPLFYRRMDKATATHLMSDQAVHRHHYPVDTWRAVLPSWRLAAARFRVVLAAGLPRRDTIRALKWVLRQTYWNRARMGRDLLDLLRYRPRQ
jgi:glycosyltransferase involved in cell wall biosynthesis